MQAVWHLGERPGARPTDRGPRCWSCSCNQGHQLGPRSAQSPCSTSAGRYPLPRPVPPPPDWTGRFQGRGEVCFDITPLVCPAYLLAEGTSVCEWDGAQQGVGTQTGKLPRGPVSQEKGCCSFLPGRAVLSPTNPHGCFHLVGPAKATPAPSSGGGSQRAWGPSRCPHRADRAASSAKPPGWARKRI